MTRSLFLAAAPLLATTLLAQPQHSSTGNYRPDDDPLPLAQGEPSDLLGRFPAPPMTFGLAFENGRLWGVVGGRELVEFDPDTGTAMAIVQLAEPATVAFGLGWDSRRDEFVATLPSSSEVVRINRAGAITWRTAAPGNGPVGAAYDAGRDGYWIIDWKLQRLDLVAAATGAQQRSLALPSAATRPAGVGYCPVTDRLLFNDRDAVKTYVVRAADGALVLAVPASPAGSNNGQGAAMRPGTLTGYRTHFEAQSLDVLDLAPGHVVPPSAGDAGTPWWRRQLWHLLTDWATPARHRGDTHG
ncbi:MAG: hypothetical protein AAF628_10625 [Planctomycetota bacterium]